MKKPKATTEKPAPKVKAERSIAPKVTKAAPKKPAAVEKTPKKAQAAAPKPVAAAPDMAVSVRVGLTAGSIWRYLAENGATPAAKLVKEIAEEEKIIQRSIGWLAQEGKISLTLIDRLETIALKE